MIPPIASRFVAGETPAAAFDHVREANEDGVKVILNLLGEHYHDREDADADAEAYVSLLRDIGNTDLDACVSVKPSQLGIDIGADVFREHYRRVVEAGDEHGVFVWCDMEDADTTDATLDAFEGLAREFGGGVGLCVQANLRRTREDLARLVDVPGKIRLVKGAYDEPESIAYTDKADVNEAYREDLEFLFKEREAGIAVGSHDPKMISLAGELSAEYGADYEVQMLMGVREDEQRRLAAEGVETWQYAPYGDKWLSYFYRRLRERKENALFALRAVAGV
ncbi:proline dehydrogenase family protein [Halobaculum sp. EA56]|uniref:proline dehydrogenase family protein n=1 Tax=Halobaculum sp. EA56 TaxID=3421648 RepID=UPI003EBD1D69